MTKWILIAVIVGALGGVVFLGVRDIHRYDSPGSASSASGPGTASSDSGSSGAENSVETIKFVKNPAPAPNFTIKTIDGKTIAAADLRGKVVLLNFWATWCPPCRAEIPDLIRLQTKYPDKLQIIGLSDDTGPVEDVKNFVAEHKMNYPIAIADPQLEAQFGGVMGLPTSFVVDTQGRVVQKHIGLRNPALYDLEVRALLDMPVQAKVETFEDQGQVFLSNAKNATEIPGIDLSKLSPEQKKAALREMNETECGCGCKLTLAQCRINDTSCDISLKIAKTVVDKIGHGTSTPTAHP
jgi:thiol-disulfide isomerase/thioredoxin